MISTPSPFLLHSFLTSMVDQRKRRRSSSRSRSTSKRPAVDLNEEERREAERIASVAKQAEERAAKCTATATSSSTGPQDEDARVVAAATSGRKLPMKIGEASSAGKESLEKPTFLSKAQRQKLALEKLEMKRQEVRGCAFFRNDFYICFQVKINHGLVGYITILIL